MTRGRKPKPPRLRLVDGSFRADRHGPRKQAEKAVAAAVVAFGKLARPKYLKGYALQAWNEYIAPADWLDGSKMPTALIFCELFAEFREAPRAFGAARHAQLRGVMADLGLTDERRRPLPDEDDKDEFFDT